MTAKLRIIESKPILDYGEDGINLNYIEAAGPSSISKPTTGIVGGSYFIETDTGYSYVFDEDSATWTKIGG